MPVGSQLNITLPTVGQAAWGGSLNTVLQTIADAIEERIPASALDINGDLDLQGNAAINVEGLGFTEGDPLIANSVFMEDGELWIRDGNNDRVQITSGGTINVTVNGGFGGDYAGNGLAVYSSAGNSYTFTSAVGVYSVMESGQVKIHNGSSTGYTSLKPPSGQTTNLDLTFPASFGPTIHRKVLEVDVTGTMTLTHTPLLSGTIAAGGVFHIVGSAEVTGNLNVQQTGTFGQLVATNRPLRTMNIPATMGTAAGGTSFINTTGLGIDLSTAADNAAFIPIPLHVGDVIDSYTGHVSKGSSSGKISWTLAKTSLLGGLSTIGGHCTTAAAASTYELGSGSLNTTVTSNLMFFVVVNGGGTTGDTFYGIEVTYRPTGTI